MLLEGVLQRKLLLEWKTLNETHVMWDLNSLELGKVKESGPYTLGLFSLVTKNVYAISFSHFIRSPLHLFDIVNTNPLKLMFKSHTTVLYTTHSWAQRCRRGGRICLFCLFFRMFFIHRVSAHMSTVQPSATAPNPRCNVIYGFMLSSWKGYIWHKIPDFTQWTHRPWANLVKPLAHIKLNHLT